MTITFLRGKSAEPNRRRAGVIGGPSARALSRPEIALPVALGLIALIGAGDYVTGYEVRLAVLYMVPIALATWVCGSAWGMAMALLGPVIWAVSFFENHPYSNPIYFFWESVAMSCMFLLLVGSLARLKRAQVRAHGQMKALLDAMPVCAYVADRDGTVLYANRQLQLLCAHAALPCKESDIADAVQAGTLGGADLAALSSSAAGAGKAHRPRSGPRYRLHRAAFSAVDGDSLILVSVIEVGGK